MLMQSGPHQTNMGNRLLRHTPTATRRLCGHDPMAPRTFRDQSNARKRPAISLSRRYGRLERPGTSMLGEFIREAPSAPRVVLTGPGRDFTFARSAPG